MLNELYSKVTVTQAELEAALETKAPNTLATTSAAGLLSASDKVKLDSITIGDGGGSDIPLATPTTNGLMPATDKAKIDNIEAGATNNFTNAVLLNRANHTGTQAISTIVNLQDILDGKATNSLATTSTSGLMSAFDKTKLNSVAPNATANSPDSVLIDRANHIGTQSADTITEGSANRLFTDALKTKLDGISAGATVNSSDATLLNRANHTGTQAISTVTGLQTALDGKATSSEATTTAAGLMSASDKVKLNGIAAGATVNSSDATLLNRANHTGTQAISTINGLQTALDSKAGTAEVTTSVAGLMSASDKIKLNNIATGATANSTDAELRDRSTHTGTQSADTITDGTTNKVFTASEKSKLAAIEAGATANSSDATLLARANHTGTQAISTVSGLQTALDAKAPLASPALTGTPTAPTATAGTNTTQLATTGFVVGEVNTAINALVDSAPGTLDTLNELAAALGDDPNFAATTTTALGNRLRVDAAQGLNSTQQAQGRTNLALGTAATQNTTAFATAAQGTKADTAVQPGNAISVLAETSTAKILTDVERTKLAGIANGATANSSDAVLLARANHTGTQSADTITDGTNNKLYTVFEKAKNEYNNLGVSLSANPNLTWRRYTALNGFTVVGAGGTKTNVDDYLRFDTATSNSQLVRTVSFNGLDNRYITLRYRRNSGTHEGTFFYRTTTRTTDSTSFMNSWPDPGLGIWTTVVLDMWDLVAGGTEWKDSSITRLRFDFSNDTVSQVDVAWIAIGTDNLIYGNLEIDALLAGRATTDVVTTTVNGLMSATDKVKLNGIATGATANSSDATLLARANHTGTQAISTIVNLQTTLDGKASTAVATTSVAGLMSASDKAKIDGIAAGATANSTDAVLLARANHTGTQIISTITGLQTALDGKASTAVATTSVDGLMSAADKTKLNGIATSATANSSDATLLARANHTGTQAISTIVNLQTTLDGKAANTNATTSVAGLMSATDKTKLDGIATGATANSSDATLLARANHTGTQAISTIVNLQTTLDNKISLDSSSTVTAKTLYQTDFSNIFLNPDFDQGVDGKDGWTSSSLFTVYTKAALPETSLIATCPTQKVLVVDRSAGGGTLDLIGTGNFPVRPAETYYYEFWYASVTGISGGSIVAYKRRFDTDNAGTPITIATITPTSTWQKYTGSFAIGTTEIKTHVGLRINTGATGVLYVSGFRLYRRSSSELIAPNAVDGTHLSTTTVLPNTMTVNGVTLNTLQTSVNTFNLLNSIEAGVTNKWKYYTELNNFSPINITKSNIGDLLHVEATTTNPRIEINLTAFSGASVRYISFRYRRTAGSHEGNIYYVTPGHTHSTSYYKNWPDQGLNVWTTVVADMWDLTAGGTDWKTSNITNFRLDFSGDSFVGDIEWIALSTERLPFSTATSVTEGFITSADKSKIDGIAVGATANSTDAVLLARANHTGTQAISTVTSLQTTLDAKAPLVSPALSGTATAPTQSASDNSTLIATTAHVNARLVAFAAANPTVMDNLVEEYQTQSAETRELLSTRMRILETNGYINPLEYYSMDHADGRMYEIYGVDEYAKVNMTSDGNILSVDNTSFNLSRQFWRVSFQGGIQIGGTNADGYYANNGTEDGTSIVNRDTTVHEVVVNEVFANSDGDTLLGIKPSGLEVYAQLTTPSFDKGLYRHPSNWLEVVPPTRLYDIGSYKPIGEDAPDVGITTPPNVTFPFNDAARATRVFQCVPCSAYTAGRLWVGFYSHSTEVNERNGGFLTVRYNDNEEQDYPLEDAVEAFYFSLPDAVNTAMADIQMWVDPIGRLWIFTGVVNNNANPNNGWGFWGFCVENPLSANPKVSRPYRLHNYGVPGKPEMIGNKVIMPVDCRETPSLADVGIYPNFVGKGMYEFDWRARVPSLTLMSKLPNDVTTISYQETSIAETRTGGIMAVYRVQQPFGGAYISRNTTGAPGNWTQGVAWTALPTSNTAESKKRIRKLKSGNLIVAFNNASDRTQMTIGISTDDGVTLKSYVTVRGGTTYCSYPDIDEGCNGKIIVTYDVDRFAAEFPVGFVEIVTLYEEDLLNATGAATIPFVVSRIV